MIPIIIPMNNPSYRQLPFEERMFLMFLLTLITFTFVYAIFKMFNDK